MQPMLSRPLDSAARVLAQNTQFGTLILNIKIESIHTAQYRPIH